MHADSLKTIQKTHLYSKKPGYFASENYERRNHNFSGVSTTGFKCYRNCRGKKHHAKDLNIDERISLFKDQLKKEFIYRIPLLIFQILEKLIFLQKLTLE